MSETETVQIRVSRPVKAKLAEIAAERQRVTERTWTYNDVIERMIGLLEEAMTPVSAADLSRPCGCRYVQAGPSWYQVLACPDHALELAPMGRIEIPEDAQ